MADLLTTLRQAGFQGEALRTAYGVAMAESGGNARALNPRAPDYSLGLFQINLHGPLRSRIKQFGLQSEEDLYDPLTNAKIAYRMSGGGKNWQPWTTFTSGAYRKHKLPGSAAAQPTSSPADAQSRLPAELQAYVQRALKGKAPAFAGAQAAPAQAGVSSDIAMYVKRALKGKPYRPQMSPDTAEASVSVPKPGGGWGGSFNVASGLAELGRANGLNVISEKRDRKHTASGGVSDHWTGSKNAYAFDLSNGDSPTPEMDRTAQMIAARLGVDYDGKSELVLTKTIGKYRVQVLYRTNVGGNHHNHVHLGVRLA